MMKKRDKYTFDINGYEIIRKISQGGFGIINLVRNKTTGDKYACKTNLINTELTTARNKQLVSREVGILIRFQHPTIVQFRGYSLFDFSGQENTTILMDYMKGGSLADLLEKEQKSNCPPDYDNTKRQIILIGIARGMMLLHSHHVIHRDLKAENILLDNDFRPRITDFGLSKFFDPKNSMSQTIANAGTAAYMAPEVIDSDHFNTKADVYAFGILMYEIVSGKRAYFELLHGKKKINAFQLKMKVSTENLRPTIDAGVKKGFKKMIEKCWSKEPRERPTFEEIYSKLSLSQDDYFLQFENSYVEPNVIDDVDEDYDEEGDDGEKDIDLIRKTRFCFDSVDFDEIYDYIDDIQNDTQTLNSKKEDDSKSETIEELKKQIKQMNKTIKMQSEKISSLESSNEKDQKIKKMSDQVKSMDSIIKRQSEEISSLKKQLENIEFNEEEVRNMRQQIKNKLAETSSKSKNDEAIDEQKREIFSIQQKISRFISAEISLTAPGLLLQLKNKEKTPFDRLFVASKSQRDIYNLIDPKTEDMFGTNAIGFYIEFEIEEIIRITGVKIVSSYQDYPKSFDILIDGETVKSIKEANELNRKYGEMIISIEPPRYGRKIRFVQTGNNWEENTIYYFIKRFDILTNDRRYPNGVFSTLVNQSINQDPHKSRVRISSTTFDTNQFFLINTENSISLLGKENIWFQVELTQGFAILYGYRLKKISQYKIRNYEIICTDDVNKPISCWFKLIQINEQNENEHELLDVYKFDRPSPPVRFVRIIQTGPNWSNKYSFKFYHFDLFGSYF